MSIILNFIHSLLLQDIQISCALTHGLLRLSYVFFDNYMPKDQMSSGPHGPIFSIAIVELLKLFENSKYNVTNVLMNI